MSKACNCCTQCGCNFDVSDIGVSDICPDCTYEAFEGLDYSYKKMEEELYKIAPTCHFRKMFLDTENGQTWWECSFCGHTKNA